MSYIRLPDGTVFVVPQEDEKGKALTTTEQVAVIREVLDGYSSN